MGQGGSLGHDNTRRDTMNGTAEWLRRVRSSWEYRVDRSGVCICPSSTVPRQEDSRSGRTTHVPAEDNGLAKTTELPRL